jgi:hypothetical protein
MTLLEAQKLTLRVLKQVMEEKLDHHNVQLAQACISLRSPPNIRNQLRHRSRHRKALQY